MKTKQIVLSDGEWKLMKLLWENAPMTLGDMVEAMQDDTAWSKGTIFTMLRRMSAKGAVRMDDSGKYQQYYPVLQKEEAEQTETRSFLERVYDGSVGMMLSAMAHDRKLSKSEIDELYKIIQNARKETAYDAEQKENKDGKCDTCSGAYVKCSSIMLRRRKYGTE